MIGILAGILGLAAFDCWFTYRQFKKFGTKVELNNLVRWLAEHVGLKQGVLVGVLVPTLSGVALLAKYDMGKTACVYLGMRLTLAIHQIKFLKDFAKKIELLSKRGS
jgi:hypothetical protein